MNYRVDVKPYRHSQSARYVVRVPTIDGKRVRKFFREGAEAHEYAAKAAEQLRSQGPSP